MSERQHAAELIARFRREEIAKGSCVTCAMGIAVHRASQQLGKGSHNWRRVHVAAGYTCERECGQAIWELAFGPAAVAANDPEAF